MSGSVPPSSLVLFSHVVLVRVMKCAGLMSVHQALCLFVPALGITSMPITLFLSMLIRSMSVLTSCNTLRTAYTTNQTGFSPLPCSPTKLAPGICASRVRTPHPPNRGRRHSFYPVRQPRLCSHSQHWEPPQLQQELPAGHMHAHLNAVRTHPAVFWSTAAQPPHRFPSACLCFHMFVLVARGPVS